VIEHRVATNNPKHPQITLFLRLPNGVERGEDVGGVIALCVLAASVDEIRGKLENENPGDEMGRLGKYADRRGLAILCWGARVLWRAGASYDELERHTNRELDKAFDAVANAWERGVVELNEAHGVPTENFLLWGSCGAAQWAHRLALRKPHRFLAIYAHMPSSFDEPTPEAANMLWLLTVGELDSGYERGARFFRDCRDRGYPIIFKGIMGLGHAGSPIADDLGMAVFDHALSRRNQKQACDEHRKAQWRSEQSPTDWRAGFFTPLFVGDYMNQRVVPASEAESVPSEFRVPLPDETIALKWNR
jgi:hypothetical protein